MEFTIMWGETPTTMTRIAEKATGYTYYDTYQIAGGPAFRMYRDHFDVRRMRGAPVFVVEDKPIVVQDGRAPSAPQDHVGVLVKGSDPEFR